MAAGIFHIDAEGRLVELTEEAYDSEELLQSLLADYPALLAGDQISSEAPQRWLLVRREASASIPAWSGHRSVLKPALGGRSDAANMLRALQPSRSKACNL